MKTTTKILIITFSLLLGLSILFLVMLKINTEVYQQVDGSGNVITQEKLIGNFDKLGISGNLEVFLLQGDSASLVIRGDDNLIELVGMTENKGMLDLYMLGRKCKESTLELHLTLVDLNSLTVSRGARVSGKQSLSLDSLNILASSGTNIELSIETQFSNVTASSGSTVELTGKTLRLEISSRGGASFKGAGFEASDVVVLASSGSSNDINALNNLNIKASSGSMVNVYGTPAQISSQTSSGADVKHRN